MVDIHERLFLPALRATMGDWVYYISFMSMEDIATRVSVVDDIHSSESLKEWLQRGLTDNSVKITTYLLGQEQRLFNAIVVGTYGGHPNWHEISVKGRNFAEVPENIEGTIGLLELSGDETLFAIDGQHRVKGIMGAIGKNEGLKNEKVCTIFIQGVIASRRDHDPDGFQRTRRLFSTLNRYAKPVRKRDIIALDEDDITAIITRRLLEEHPLLMDKVDMGMSKSIRSTDQTNLTTIVTVYDVVDIVLSNDQRGWKDYKRWRPPESEVEVFYQTASEFWDALCYNFISLKELRDSSPKDNVTGKYRSPNGGNLLFRPVGLMLIGRVVADLRLSADMSLAEAIEAVGHTPTNLAENPWIGLLWDNTNKRMLTTKENQKVARQLLFNALGGDLTRAPFKTSRKNVREELAGLLNRDPKSVSLPYYFANSNTQLTSDNAHS